MQAQLLHIKYRLIDNVLRIRCGEILTSSVEINRDSPVLWSIIVNIFPSAFFSRDFWRSSNILQNPLDCRGLLAHTYMLVTSLVSRALKSALSQCSCCSQSVSQWSGIRLTFCASMMESTQISRQLPAVRAMLFLVVKRFTYTSAITLHSRSYLTFSYKWIMNLAVQCNFQLANSLSN